MSSPYTIFILLIFAHILFLGVSSSPNSNLINQTCKNISKSDPNLNYNFCVYALQSAPSSRCANLTRLGLISINLIKNNVTDTKCLAKQLLKDNKVDKITKEGLKDCLELYSDSIPTLREVARDFRANRFIDANVKLSSVMESSNTCEEGFQDVQVKSPLTKQNNNAFQLCAISLSIVNMFHRSIPMQPPISRRVSGD